MTNLYPLKFTPILKERIWGGDKLSYKYGKPESQSLKVGESWELSALQGDISVVSNGFLEGNSLEEIIEVYMGDLVGDSVYDRFGNEFPLLIKLIDAREVLSIQVHPGNELARARHNAYGKSEMWYILESEPDSKIYCGFSNDTSADEYLDNLSKGTLHELLNSDHPKEGDLFLIPSGRIHALGGGIVLAEIQQTSDITYRLYDWGRVGTDGTPRELHNDLAIEAIDFSKCDSYLSHPEPLPGEATIIGSCEYFTVSMLTCMSGTRRDYTLHDSFVLYICTDGQLELNCDGVRETLKMGETILIPAVSREVEIMPEGKCSLLEVYVQDNHINE